MNVGYYPIRENEMMQIIKMVNQYKKKDFSVIDEILEKYNVNQEKKDDIYKSFEECVENMSSLCFNKSYGLCIAKVQKVYRGNFIFYDKFATKLMQIFPALTKYRTNWEEIIKSKNNKYKFFY